MADPKIKYTFTGDSEDAQAAIARLEKKYDDLENKIKRGNTSSKTATDGWAGSIGSVAEKYVGVASVIAAVGVAVKGTVAENQKLLEQMDEIGRKNAETSLKLQIQGALTSPEVKALMPVVESALGVTPSAGMNDALKIQTQLASSGFAQADVKSGEALKAMLDIKAATNQFGESIGNEAEAAKSLSMLLKAGGSESPTAKEMRNLGGSIVSLFESSDVQFPDFQQLAPKIAGLKNFGLSMEESVGVFSALTDIMGGNKADTGLSQFVSRTATAGAFKERAAELQKLGINPSDVAMAPGGRGIVDTIDLLRGKLKTLDAESRNGIIAKLYGEEAGPAASYLLSDSGSAKVKDYIDRANTRDAFERNVTTFQESRYASDARAQIAQDFAAMKMDEGTGGVSWSEYQRTRRALQMQQSVGDSPFMRSVGSFGRFVEGMTDLPYQMLGMTPVESLGSVSDIQQQVKQNMISADPRVIEQNTAALNENTRAMNAQKERGLNRNGQVE